MAVIFMPIHIRDTECFKCAGLEMWMPGFTADEKCTYKSLKVVETHGTFMRFVDLQ
jgi:hypothetical protein